uniref:Uncharacterized protein n=1 Tax=Rhizophora mucronata TaxID=61149 RepID=A0A2P2KG96_RHIMU
MHAMQVEVTHPPVGACFFKQRIHLRLKAQEERVLIPKVP